MRIDAFECFVAHVFFGVLFCFFGDSEQATGQELCHAHELHNVNPHA